MTCYGIITYEFLPSLTGAPHSVVSVVTVERGVAAAMADDVKCNVEVQKHVKSMSYSHRRSRNLDRFCAEVNAGKNYAVIDSACRQHWVN